MKKTFVKLSFLTYLAVCIAGCAGEGNSSVSYYINPSEGSDTQKGLSENQSWKSLNNLKDIQLNPGDRVLLKRGEKLEGILDITAKGSASQPIVIGAYGEGLQKPVLSAPDSSLFTIRILNSEYVTVQDLEIINRGSTDLPSRTGVKVESMDYGVSKGIRLKNLSIRDVNGSIEKWVGGGSGILLVNGGKETVSTFDSLTIEYCHIKNCYRNAMIWAGYSDRADWHPNTHVWVHHNLIEEVPGDGIVPIGCDGAVIEYNVMRSGTTAMLHSNREAAAGIWPWACDNTVIRFNEVSDHKGTWDGQGFDADYNCVNTLIEYNYSHGNDGGMVLICSSGDEDRSSYCIGNENPTVRYNISIGDGNRPFQTRGRWFSPSIHIAGPVRNAVLYRNIIRNKVKASPEIDGTMIVSDDWTGCADSTVIRENIFYTPEVSCFNMTNSTHNFFERNFYVGNFKNKPNEKDSRELDPAKIRLLESEGSDGLMQLMDSVTIAGNTKCVFVSKEKIEKFFNSVVTNK